MTTEAAKKPDALPPAPAPELGGMLADKLIAEANGSVEGKSRFDYIIVGSGAGGGPLAARLALAGKKVLVIEAGRDPESTGPSPAYPKAALGEVTRVPGYYAAASEDAEMSWMFSVRHHADDGTQGEDEKYAQAAPPPPPPGEKPKHVFVDPNSPPGQANPMARKYLDPHPNNGGKQGIFYPRSAGVGGCTAHHAMITIAPNDKDWNYIANLTGDESWRAGRMRGYFAKFERNQYLAAYDRFLRNFLGIFYRLYRRVVLIFDPRAVLDNGGHGFEGWAPTNLIDPFLISTIEKGDRPFFRLIVRAALAVLHGSNVLFTALKHALLRSRVVQAIDFNDVNTRRTNPEGVFLIPIGTESGAAGDVQGRPGTGRRFGVRELLLSTARDHPDKLVIKTGAHVTRVVFEKDGDNAPRAIGVECAVGDHLYEASPKQVGAPKERVYYFTKAEGGEVILCGGAFNTPQLLMLSGIGDKTHLASKGIQHLCGSDGKPLGDGRTDKDNKSLPPVPVIHLPGVGSNLQDRYEVTVVSELDKDFATLKTVSFEPGDGNDGARSQWLNERTGLYTTNGGTLAVIRRSKPAEDAGEPEPDLFTFGAPAAFRGYYWNWSRELFKPTLGAVEDKRRLWSWVILKAYTRNDKGTVRLRTASPFDMPEICFDAFNEEAELEAAKIEHECQPYLSKGESLPPALAERRKTNGDIVADSRRDLAALADTVAFMRAVNARNPEQFVAEIQPGDKIKDGSREMERWIKTQAWGHHASCTCRIGSDRWQADTGQLSDRGAVLDSRFRVHGVTGLRVVDASVFPRIPGYFIFAPIFMVSEKAADTLLEDAAAAVYPATFKAQEAGAIRQRRVKARTAANAVATTGDDELPDDTVGLALSGGGIRSATFALGVLQALAERNRLRDVDLLSTVSGGGFIGSFLGRLFTREMVKIATDPCGRVQDTLKDSGSAPLWWLRTQANYIFATGANDVRLNLAVFWRNIFSMHLVIGTLLFTLFGLLAWLPGAAGILSDMLGLFRVRAIIGPLLAPPVFRGLELSAWWWLPVVALALGVLPGTLGYWLAPKVGSYRPYPFFALLAWLVLLAGSAVALLAPGGLRYAGGALLVLLLAWLWQEAATWGAAHGRETEATRRQVGSVVRNRLSRALGEAVVIFAGLAAWVVLDTFAALFAQKTSAAAMATVLAAAGPLLPALRKLALGAKKELSLGGAQGFSLSRTANLLGIPLAVLLLFAVDVLAHHLFAAFPGQGIYAVVLTGVFSLALGRAFDFLNLSSLHATYAARLTRTFQGASNEERVYTATSNDAHNIGLSHSGDDLPHDQYHPEAQGGPLHLINVCVNETVDVASDREVRERKGLPMCVTPHGVSVGRRYFAKWTEPDDRPYWQKLHRWVNGLDGEESKPAGKRRLTALAALPVSSDPNAFHVLKTTGSPSAEVESLSLGTWIAISGAAFSTGIGRGTRLPLALFMGLANVRLGYWWDSGIREQDRPGRYPLPLWRKLQRIPVALFRMQSLLLAEWKARFHGAARWFWYLSDGGHFEVTGLYELLRRRVPFMVASDAGEDPKYRWGDVALLTQQVREDFGAEVVWLDPQPAGGGARPAGWAAFPEVPAWIQNWMNPDTLGALKDIGGVGTHHAALARVTYPAGPRKVCWILLLKPSLAAGLTEDIANYAKENPEFPQQPTFDQVFDDIQWESYRALGQQVGRRVLR